MIYESREAYLEAGCDPERIVHVTTVEADSVTDSFYEMDTDLAVKLADARAHWAELKEAGTPYWCVHENRFVTHPQAYWQDDQPSGIHRKHGVRCRECGGYIQEG